MRSLLLSAVAGLSAVGLALVGPAAVHAEAMPAKIRVTLPPDASLLIDGEATHLATADRTFVTPPLEAGQVFHYTLKAHYVSGDDAVTVERRVAVRAGQETRVTFTAPNAGDDNRAFYFDTAAAPVTNPAQANYYNPSVPFFVVPNLEMPHGGVGGARDNWKPDSADPFYIGHDW